MIAVRIIVIDDGSWQKIIYPALGNKSMNSDPPELGTCISRRNAHTAGQKMRFKPQNIGAMIAYIDLRLSPAAKNLRLSIDSEISGTVRAHDHVCIISWKIF